MESRIAPMDTLLETIPEEDRPRDAEMANFWLAVAFELCQMLQFANTAQRPQVVLNECRKAGEQYIWEFYVNDLAKPLANEYNFHGQNTSQWLYAGCILLQGGRVSRHH